MGYLPVEVKAQARAVSQAAKAVDDWPEAVSMLRADEQNSSQVVATNVDGTPALVIQTTT